MTGIIMSLCYLRQNKMNNPSLLHHALTALTTKIMAQNASSTNGNLTTINQKSSRDDGRDAREGKFELNND